MSHFLPVVPIVFGKECLFNTLGLISRFKGSNCRIEVDLEIFPVTDTFLVIHDFLAFRALKPAFETRMEGILLLKM